MASEQSWGPKNLTDACEDPRTLTELVVGRLRGDIISNRLEPGARLGMTDLMRRYDVGSSPIREALFRVASEGLIRNVAHHGFRVAEINPEEMLDISTLRADLEARAIRLSMQFRDDAWVHEVRAAKEQLAKTHLAILHSNSTSESEVADEWERAHRGLHLALCGHCKSPWLLHFINVLYDHLERYRRHLWDYGARVGGADDEHDAIVETALNGFPDEAIDLLRRHFKTQAELSLSVNGASRAKQA